MEKKLEESLRHTQSHPTTGLPHNENLISVQVENIFAIDNLAKKIDKLAKTIDKNEKQSKKLEESNYKLQVVLLILTAIATAVAVYPVINKLTNWLYPYIALLVMNITHISFISENIISIITVVVTILSAIVTFVGERKFINRYKLTINDNIKLKESLSTSIKDKKGNLKEKRNMP